MSKEGKEEIRKHIFNRFSSLSRELLRLDTEDRNLKKCINEIEDECHNFKTFMEKEVNYLATSVPRCRTFIETTLRIFLTFFGRKTFDSFSENEKSLKSFSHYPDAEILYHYVKTIRISANKKAHQNNKEIQESEVDESSAILLLALTVVDKFCRIIISHKNSPQPKQEELTPIKQQLQTIIIKAPDITPKPTQEFTTINHKPEIQVESSLSFKVFSVEQFPFICMENASGLKCFRGCREHSTPSTLYMSYTTIGTKQCHHGSHCQKNKILLGNEKKFISVCPSLHNDRFDDIKRTLGHSWKKFSKGEIKYDDIFLQLQKEQTKVSLISEKRCQHLPCLLNACGLPCSNNCKEHSDETTVYYTYTKIGIEKCEFKENCNKKDKVFELKDGRKCDQCPFLHGDEHDNVKKRIAMGWSSYSSNQCKYYQIFTDEPLSKTK